MQSPRYLLLVVCALAVGVLAAPAAAQAGPYLSASDARATAGRILHKEWQVVPGSGSFYCPATRGRPDYRVCGTAYTAVGAGCYTTALGIRKLWGGGYRYRVLYDRRCR